MDYGQAEVVRGDDRHKCRCATNHQHNPSASINAKPETTPVSTVDVPVYKTLYIVLELMVHSDDNEIRHATNPQQRSFGNSYQINSNLKTTPARTVEVLVCIVARTVLKMMVR